LRARERMTQSVTTALQSFHAMLLPTVPIVAPPMRTLEDDQAYGRTNALALRNPSVVNFIDGCAISVPCHRRSDAPVGLMIAAPRGADRQVLTIAHAIEHRLTRD
jgi:aspartyl-tRNA(Asn)/glutamyl-tRNA(Gln) amidotransferase subunit A